MDRSAEFLRRGLIESEHGESIQMQPRGSGKRKSLSGEEKKLVFECLMNSLDEGKLKRGAMKETAARFCVRSKTVKRFWEQAISEATHANDDASEEPANQVQYLNSYASVGSIPLNASSTIDMSTELIPLELNEPDQQKSIELKPQGSRKQKILSNEEKRLIFECLLNSFDKGKLKWGAVKTTADQFCVTPKTVKRLWEKAISRATTLANDGASEQHAKPVGRKRIGIDFEKAARIDLSRHTSIRSLAKALNMSVSTLHRRFKEGTHPFTLNASTLNEIRFVACSSDEEGEFVPEVGKTS